MNRFLVRRRIITLLTDFGYADHYVGTMKGVLLSRCLDAYLVDITHDVRPFSILEGAYALAQAAPYFPAGTVHLAVVDPGVGTERRAIAVLGNKQLFVGPDNGLFEMALDGHTWRARELSRFHSHSASNTFHGRDVFAVAAADLACEAVPFEEAGLPVANLAELPSWRERAEAPDKWNGTVLSIDRYGNVITSLRSASHSNLARQRFQITMNGTLVTSFYPTFGTARESELFVYHGSSGFIELGVREGSAAASLNAIPGQPVTLTIPS